MDYKKARDQNNSDFTEVINNLNSLFHFETYDKNCVSKFKDYTEKALMLIDKEVEIQEIQEKWRKQEKEERERERKRKEKEFEENLKEDPPILYTGCIGDQEPPMKAANRYTIECNYHKIKLGDLNIEKIFLYKYHQHSNDKRLLIECRDNGYYRTYTINNPLQIKYILKDFQY
jgi:hypothetical protein